jgi:hypothetical protein
MGNDFSMLKYPLPVEYIVIVDSLERAVPVAACLEEKIIL